MSIEPGTRLGPYEILSPLGAGGMGEVYKAKDTRLDRTVAIKVLPEHLSKDPERRERLQREARAISSLNHPHICTLHDVGEHEGIDFLVMEYIEGETLADRLQKGALPLEQALQYGAQIADALDKAHRKRIVHRDLKPGNIMTTRPGVKLLDFGLAKFQQHDAPTADSEQPTQHKPLTDAGTIMGTVQYMAPEQLEGKDADARSDIFAFGAILYEMITGQKAFAGSSQASLITAIMSADPPPISELQSMSPHALDRVVKKCLAKDPEDRWHSAHDLADELEWVTTPVPETPLLSGRGGGRSRVIVAALLFALGGFALWSATQSQPPPPVGAIRLPVTVPSHLSLAASETNLIPLALSPDGQRLVFVAAEEGKTQLYLRTLDAFELVPLPGTEGASQPFFSPDGAWLGFHRNRQLQKISLAGGAPVVICDAPEVWYRPTWGVDDTIVFNRGTRSGLARVHAGGGVPETLTTPDDERDEQAHDWPQFLPDGRRLLFTVKTQNDDTHLAMLSMDTGEWQHINGLSDASTASYVESKAKGEAGGPGHLVFLSSGNLTTQPFDLSRLEPVGSPIALDSVFTIGIAAHYAVSANGSLAYVPGLSVQRRPIWVNGSGGREGTPIDLETSHLTLASDGQRLALNWNADIWILDLVRGTRLRLTTDGASTTPIWSPDGTAVVFRKVGRDLVRKRADGSGDEEPLQSNEHTVFVTSWSPDGGTIAYEEQNPETGRDLWLLPLEDGARPEPFLVTPFQESGLRFSPDGSLVAYVSDETGSAQVYVRRYPRTGAPLPISSSGGSEPTWPRKGNELFYRNGDKMMAVTITTEPTLDSDTPRVLFEAPYFVGTDHAHYDVAPDGERFMMLTRTIDDSVLSQINIVLNWAQELERATTEN